MGGQAGRQADLQDRQLCLASQSQPASFAAQLAVRTGIKNRIKMLSKASRYKLTLQHYSRMQTSWPPQNESDTHNID